MLLSGIVWSIGLALAAVGLAGLLVGWLTPWKAVRRRRAIFSALLGVGLLVFVSCCTCKVWVGHYLQAEYQITFQDPGGNPVEGIELRVEDPEGRDYFHFPVDDYLPGQAPTSDRNGLMVFHHVQRSVELTGRTYYVFFVIPIRDPGFPVFLCRFLYQGQEVYRVPFLDLERRDESCDQVPMKDQGRSSVKRYWQPPAWPEIEPKPNDAGKNWNDQIEAIVDRNGDGRLNAEERAAYRSAERQAYEVQHAKRHGLTRDAEIGFVLVRKTVTVRLPER